MRQSRWAFLLVSGVVVLGPELGCAGPAAGGELMICQVLATDVRRDRSESSFAYEHDPAQETQLLYGELVRAYETAGGWPRPFVNVGGIHAKPHNVTKGRGWRRIAAVEQPEYTHHRRWEGYPGWVQAEHLLPAPPEYHPNLVVVTRYAFVVAEPDAQPQFPVAFGTQLMGLAVEGEWWRLRLADGAQGWIRKEMVQPLNAWDGAPPAKRRRAIVQSAERLVGDPYRWGGRSPQVPFVQRPVTGTDCSGLVHLAYRAQGVAIPRDAHEQFMRSRRLAARELQPGDLVFLSAAHRPRRITHVMLYAGGDEVIEGPGTGQTVRRITLAERLGPDWRAWASGEQQVGNQTVYFGSPMTGD